MKLRNLIAVLAALAIVGGIYAFAVTREDESRGAVSVWYVEGGFADEELNEAARDYNKSSARGELPVRLTGFESEEAMAEAFDKSAPDLIFCSHYRAFDMHSRSKLTDLSAQLGADAPDYPKELSSRSACIGKSFFPVGSDVPVLLVNSALAQGAEFADMEAMSAEAEAYRASVGAPYYAAESYCALFFTELLREGEEFSAALETKPSEAYTTLYNLLAENAYSGAMTVLPQGAAADAVGRGELACAFVMTSALPARLDRALEVRAVPPLAAPGGSGTVGTAWGFAVPAMGSRSMSDIAAFLSWLFSGNRDARFALQCRLVPAQPSSLITRDALWSTLLTLDPGGIVALPSPDGAYAERQEAFESEFRARMEFLSE